MVGDSDKRFVGYESMKENTLSVVTGRRAGVARSMLLDATAYLFSPATEGFLPKGWIGVAKELGMLRIADVRLRKAPAYSEVQPNSALLRETRKTFLHLVS